MAIDRKEMMDWLDKRRWVIAKGKEYNKHYTVVIHKFKDPMGIFKEGYSVSTFSTESDDTGCLGSIDHTVMDETELHGHTYGMEMTFLNTKKEAMKEIKETLNYIKSITTIMG